MEAEQEKANGRDTRESKRAMRMYMRDIKEKDRNRIGSNTKSAANRFDVKTFSSFDEDIRKQNVRMALLATCSILCQLFILQWPFTYKSATYDNTLMELHVAEVISLAATVMLLYSLYEYYILQVDLQRLKFSSKFVPHLWETEMFKFFVLEVIPCSMTPLPYMDMKLLGMLTFSKFYLWTRVYRDYSNIYKYRSDAIKAIDVSNGVPNFTTWLSIRTLYARYPWGFVACSVIMQVMSFSYMTYVFEREDKNQACIQDVTSACYNDPYHTCCMSRFSYFSENIYFTCVSALTIGYGEMKAASNVGRFVSMTGVLFGLCNLALFITAVLTQFKLTVVESQCVEYVMVKGAYEEEELAAARLIQAWWRRLKVNQDYYEAGEYRGLMIAKWGGSEALTAQIQILMDEKQRTLPSSTQRVGIFGDTYDQHQVNASAMFANVQQKRINTAAQSEAATSNDLKFVIEGFRAISARMEEFAELEKECENDVKDLLLEFSKLPQVLDPQVVEDLNLGTKIPRAMGERGGASNFHYLHRHREKGGSNQSEATVVQEKRAEAPTPDELKDRSTLWYEVYEDKDT